MSPLPCPTCAAELTFLAQYQRHFCYHCHQYAPEGYGAKGEKKCPNCAGILSYIVQYDRLYCFRCGIYPPPVEGPTVGPAATPEPPKEIPTEKPPEAPEAEMPAVATPAEPSAPAASPVPSALMTIPPTRKLEEISREVRVVEAPAAVTKPPLVRDEILGARKPILMDLCKAYDLDPSGTKEQLRERLLSYLDELEGEARPEPLEPESKAESEPAPEAVPPEAVPELKLEPFVERREGPIATPAPAIVIQEEKPPEPKVEVVPEMVHEAAPKTKEEIVPQPVVEPAAPPAAPSPPTKVEHPCPTCGRELEYVSQYNRWYCYSCKSYAPAMAPKNACPTCGATMRWIDRYRRWWCDSCRGYAPADLPPPKGVPAAAEAARPALLVETKATVAHRHRSPSSGISLAAFGLALWVVYEVLVEVPAVFSVNLGIAVERDYAFLFQFGGLLFLAVGMLLALAALKERP